MYLQRESFVWRHGLVNGVNVITPTRLSQSCVLMIPTFTGLLIKDFFHRKGKNQNILKTELNLEEKISGAARDTNEEESVKNCSLRH